MQLYEKYRPKTFADFIGQDKIKKQIKRLLGGPDWNRDAFWLQGPSGTGKTSLAWIIANQLVGTDWAVTELNGDSCNKDMLDDIRRSIWLSAPKGKWKVLVVNESHAMSRTAVQGWLTLLENLPKYRLVIFTTTESLENNLFGSFSKPFARRCKIFNFTKQGLAEDFAVRAKQIARAEGLDNKPLHAYVRLVQKWHNNMGAVLQAVEQGVMLA